MIWRDIKQHPIPNEGFVIVWPTEGGVPDVWAGQTYHEAQQRRHAPGQWKLLAEEADGITHWAQLPPTPEGRGGR